MTRPQPGGTVDPTVSKLPVLLTLFLACAHAPAPAAPTEVEQVEQKVQFDGVRLRPVCDETCQTERAIAQRTWIEDPAALTEWLYEVVPLQDGEAAFGSLGYGGAGRGISTVDWLGAWARWADRWLDQHP